MVVELQAQAAGLQLSEEVWRLAQRVQVSVVAVHGSRRGVGSGVVWSERGLVVTNDHVVPGRWAEVGLGNGARTAARVVVRAPGLDLAALQVEEEAFPSDGVVAAQIGDSSSLRVGQLVVAVGNPLGERNAVALGVVSGLGWEANAKGLREVIRAALTLRPGNSGGALADIEGRVVGIPHMVGGAGLALAVPSHVVERFLRGELGQ